jgi:hypothetical protein
VTSQCDDLARCNVLIEIVAAESTWTSWTQEHLSASSEDGLVINVVIYAEIAPCFSSKDDADLFLSDFSIRVIPVTERAAYLASLASAAGMDLLTKLGRQR